MAHARVARSAPVAVLIVGCAATEPAPAAAVAPPPASVETRASFQGARWGTFHSKRFELSLGLPDGSTWKIDDHRSGWLKATHAPTRSALLVRAWSESENVTRKACYARARQWESGLPDLEAQPLIDDQLRTLLGYRDSARVAVGVLVRGGAEPATGGFVVAIVGEIRRCFLVAFQTEASGAEAEDEIADRLAIVTDRLLPSMKLDQSFTPSREPAMLPPAGPGGAGGAR
jgi:hypothetical protein